MAKTYKCKLCGDNVRQSVIPQIIAKEQLCVECYKTKCRVLDDALKATYSKP